MPEDTTPPPAEDDKKVLLSGRVRESVRKRMKVYSALSDINMQDLLDAALDEYLRKRGA